MNCNAPDFFIVGAPKAGTTTLYSALEGIESIYMPTIKEPNFFSSNEIFENQLYYSGSHLIRSKSEYIRLFSPAGEQQLVGEASVSYLFYPEVARRIKNWNENAKIIISLRNPIDRAYSHYLMDSTSGYITNSFEHLFDEFSESVFSVATQQVFELSLYYSQVRKYQSIFSKNNVLIIFQEDLKNGYNKTISKVLAFLDVKNSDNSLNELMMHRYVAPRNKLSAIAFKNQPIKNLARKILPQGVNRRLKRVLVKESKAPLLDQSMRQELVSFYREDVRKLAGIVESDFPESWNEYF